MNKSVIVIGNGSSLRDSNLGNKIDEFDEVIRINNWKTTLFEKDVGSKITIWVMYNPKVTMPIFINGYTELGLDMNQIKDTLKELKEIWFVCWKFENLLENWKDNQLIKDLGVYDRCKRHLSIQTSKKIRGITDPPSTGFSLLYILSQMYEPFYITGFDFGNILTPNAKYHHYFGNKMSANNTAREIHHLQFEYWYISNLIKEGKIRLINRDTIIEPSRIKNTHKTSSYCDKCKSLSLLYD
jgi:hypothetical protein